MTVLPFASTSLSTRVPSEPPAWHPAMRLLTVTVSPVSPDAVVIAVHGEVDRSTNPHLEHVLLSYLHDAAPLVIVDLTGVSFLGAAGLTALVVAREAAVTAGIRLCVVAQSRPVLLPLTITGLAGMFDIRPDLADALPHPDDSSAG